jgi:hypothetical protein
MTARPVARALAHIIHDGSSRNRGVVWRDGQAQYVEGLSDEHARHTKLRLSRRVQSPAAEKFLTTDLHRRSSESAIAAETFMNNVG